MSGINFKDYQLRMKKHIRFKDGSQVWRILISPTGNLIIETRDTEKKEAYFSCYNLESGKKVFKSHQLAEKYWIGIEDLYKDTILFHRFAKPDLPGHKSIIAFDVNSKQIAWENNDYSFLFLYDDIIYCYTQKFEGRLFYTIDPVTGNIIDELGDDALAINKLKYKTDDARDFSDYVFPQISTETDNSGFDLKTIIREEEESVELAGEVEYVIINELLLVNFHHKISTELLENKFFVYNIAMRKTVKSEILNSAVNSYVPDSFFVYQNFLILLKEKSEVVVYKLD